jgi:phosphatidylserine decarboxylase
LATDGLKIIIIALIFTILLIIFAFVTNWLWLKILAGISVILAGLILWFFRDPERTVPEGENLIVSPADGTVILMQNVYEGEYLKQDVQQVSIFLSPLDVHVNRIPMSGRVGFYKYFPGKFMPAFKDKASTDNEQTIIGVENGKCKIVFKQIAGWVARRIVCRLKEGDEVKIGERFGMMKFGSRMDLLLPKNVEVKVKLKDTVKAGETIIGIYK